MANEDPIAQPEIFDITGGAHADERGWVLFPWDTVPFTIDPATVHVVQVKPGAIRGNHYHPRASEFICALEGVGLLLWRAPDDERTNELELATRRACVRIPPGVRHAVTNRGDSDFIILVAREMDEQGDLTEAGAP